MNKTTNVENFHLLGTSYPVLCDRLEIQISVKGGYKRTKGITDNIRLLSDTQSLSSLFNFYKNIHRYLSPTIKDEEHKLNDMELKEKTELLSRIIIQDESPMFNVKYTDYDCISSLNIDLFLHFDNRIYQLNSPIFLTYKDFFNAIQKDKYLLAFLSDLTLQDKLYANTQTNTSNYFRERYYYLFNFPDKSIRDNNGDINLFNLTVACVFAVLKKNFPTDYEHLMLTLEPDICVI